MSKKRILYIMGIDWEWIYQRPQIIAEKLSKYYDVTVVFPRNVIVRNKKSPCVEGIDFRILWTLPFQEKNTLLGKWSMKQSQKIFKDIETFDCIYVGYPLYARYIPAEYKGKIIYDCMDNHEMLYPDQKRVHKVVKQETELIEKCDLLLVSAGKLKEKADRIAGREKSKLLRNGTEINHIYAIKETQQKEKYSLGYFGTIAKWFDYEALKVSLDKIEKIEYQLVGPIIDKVDRPGIIYHGPVSKSALGEKVKDCDCLVMPFQVNEIVSYVDPVKLYEYIAMGKCIVSVYYPEIEHFKDFVYFYKDREEYVRLLQELVEKGFPVKYTKMQQEAFLKDNSWDERYSEVKKYMVEINM